MIIYSKKQYWKILLLFAAIIIGFSSLHYTNKLVKQISVEEDKKVKTWAEATRKIIDPDVSEKDMIFLLAVIENNKTVPAILTDSAGNIVSHNNLDSIKSLDTSYVSKRLEHMKKQKKPILVTFGGEKNYIYYEDSYILQQLIYYPYIQLGVILLFILVAYLAFSASRKAEQNQVWVGLTKETAHQLGTPTSSLLAWTELLKERLAEPELVSELEKDVKRLELITDRFSKIGSKPTLKPTDLKSTIISAVDYLKNRTSDKIKFSFDFPEEEIVCPISKSLFEWVVENLCKNAVDAISSSGLITITLKQIKNKIIIDFTDTGKGIPKSKFKTVFKPGFTTKARGWGLGLSLAKRIIETYHMGKIFVHSSEQGKGTTFRIILNNK